MSAGVNAGPRAAADLADEVGFDRVTVSAVARGFGGDLGTRRWIAE